MAKKETVPRDWETVTLMAYPSLRPEIERVKAVQVPRSFTTDVEPARPAGQHSSTQQLRMLP